MFSNQADFGGATSRDAGSQNWEGETNAGPSQSPVTPQMKNRETFRLEEITTGKNDGREDESEYKSQTIEGDSREESLRVQQLRS